MCKVASIRELIENLLPKEQGNKFYVQLLEINKQLIKKKKRHSKLNNKENQKSIKKNLNETTSVKQPKKIAVIQNPNA